MKQLIVNELLKQFKKVFIWIMLIVIILSCASYAAIVSSVKEDKLSDFRIEYNSSLVNLRNVINREGIEKNDKYKVQLEIEKYELCLKENIAPSDWRMEIVQTVFDQKYGRLCFGESADNDYTKMLMKMILDKDWKGYFTFEMKSLKELQSGGVREIFEYQSNELKLNNFAYILDHGIVPDYENWKYKLTTSTLNNRIKLLKHEYKVSKADALMEEEIIEINSAISMDVYRVEHDNPVPEQKSFRSFLRNSLDIWYVVLFSIVVASAVIVTSEYSSGTIKQLTTFPYKRWKILLSKDIVVMLISFLMTLFLLICSFIVSLSFFGNSGINLPYLYLQGGTVHEINYIAYIFIIGLFMWVKILVFANITFMLAVLIKNAAVPVVIGLAGGVLGNSLAETLITRYHFVYAKYLIITNLDLVRFLEPEAKLRSINLYETIATIVVCLCVTSILSFWAFCRKDI